MTAKDWLGNSVIDRATGEPLGRVIRLIASSDRKAAVCLVIRPVDPRMPLMVLPWEKAIPGSPALAFGTDCQPFTHSSPFWESWDRQLPLGLPALDVNGASPGHCCDTELNEKGAITGFLFSAGSQVDAENIACIGSAAIILGKASELSAVQPTQQPLSPLLGRILTQDIILSSGEVLAHKDAVVDEALLKKAEAAGRLVALTLHTKPAD